MEILALLELSVEILALLEFFTSNSIQLLFVLDIFFVFFFSFKYANPVTFWLCAWRSWKKYFPFSSLVLNKGTMDDGNESGSY